MLSTAPGALGVALYDLVGLAVRRNPRRAHLLVSTVLGKHVPADPAVVRGAAQLLGLLVAQALGRPGADAALEGAGDLLTDAARGRPGAAELLVRAARPLPRSADDGVPVDDVLVIGYAETATALGAGVADALHADLITSTRREVPTATTAGGFEEEHSHATSHRLLPDDVRLLDAGTVVLVDDELTTGTTVLNTVALLERIRPHRRYVVAALADLRSPGDVARLDEVARARGIGLQAVALTRGAVRAPEDVLQRTALLEVPAPAPPTTAAPGTVQRLEDAWAADARHSGRHGFRAADRERFEAALESLAEAVAQRLPSGRIHVLGTEELLHLPQRLAGALATLRPAAQVTSSSTTRSPVVVVDDADYPIRTRIAFPAHDDPADGPGQRYAYNLGAPGCFDAIALVVDERGSTAQLTAPGGLVAQLAGLAAHVLVVVVREPHPAAQDAAPAR